MGLAEWLQGVHPWLVGLEAAVEVDFSRASLVKLEDVAAAGGDSPAFEAYLGETLLRVGGGRWVEGRPARGGGRPDAGAAAGGARGTARGAGKVR
jgi:hypothetical protein